MILAPLLDAIHHSPQRYLLGIVRISETHFPVFDGWMEGLLSSYCKSARVGKHVHRVEFGDLQEYIKNRNKNPIKGMTPSKDRVATCRKRQCTVVTPLGKEHVHAALCHDIMRMRLGGILTVHRDGESCAISFPLTSFTDDPKIHIYMDLNTFYIDYDLIEECDTALAVAAK